MKLHRNVLLNSNTTFEGWSVIHPYTDIRNTHVGHATYIGWNSKYCNCIIGKYCSIAPYSEVIYGRHPVRQFVSTHPAFFSLRKQAGFTFANEQEFCETKYADPANKKSVSIGNDVWIGYSAKILEGIRIGDGAIIGAGAVVTKDVEPYSINIGVPAKTIGYRFSEEYVEFLLNFKWWNEDMTWISENKHLFSNMGLFYTEYHDKK